jgi:hypothetical protein
MIAMWRAGICRPALLLVLIAASASAPSACRLWNHAARVEANVTLLLQLSDKLRDYCRAGFDLSGRELTSEEMGEFYYALRRARALTEQPRDALETPIDREYEEFLAAYEAFVRAADQYRLASEQAPALLEALMREHAALKRLGEKVLSDLRGG